MCIGVMSPDRLINFSFSYLSSSARAGRGIEAILHYEKREGRPAGFTREEHKRLEKKLKDPKIGLREYVEPVNWAGEEFNKTFKNNTVLKFAMRHFDTRIKVARKSPVKKR